MGKTKSSFITCAILLILLVPTLSACSPAVQQTTATTEPSQTPSAISSPTATLEPTPFRRTLDFPEAVIIHDLLTAEDCEQTCLWGITPGISGEEDIKMLFSILSSYGNTREYLYEGTKGMGADLEFSIEYSSVTEEYLSLRLAYQLDETTQVTALHGYSSIILELVDPRKQPIASMYDYFLSPWKMENIIAEFGEPAQIGMSLDPLYAEPPFSAVFYTWLVYPERGLVLRYEANARLRNENGENIRGRDQDIASFCPDNAFVDIWLSEANDIEILNKQLHDSGYYWTDYVAIPAEYKSVEDAIGISAEEFTQRLLDDDLGCFESYPRDWPIIH